MHRAFLASCALVLALLPASLAHDPPGTPRNYCEGSDEFYLHDYGAPATGLFVGLDHGIDSFRPLLPDDFIESHPPGCPTVHVDYTQGGAWLHAADTGCWPGPADHPSYPTIHVEDIVLGTITSFSVGGDHSRVPPLVGPDCGDGIIEPCDSSGPSPDCNQHDWFADCISWCTVAMPPGVDGKYTVFVQGTQGHVWTT